MSQRSSWGSNEPAARKGYRRLRYWADLHDGCGYARHSMTIKGTKRDGDSVLAKLRVDHMRDTRCVTVRYAYDHIWLPGRRARVEDGELAPSTLELYESTWRNHVEPRWGSVLIDDVRPMEVQEWLLGMTRWNATYAKTVASSVVDNAILLEQAHVNAFARKYHMPVAAETRTKDIWTLGQIAGAVERLRGTVLEVPAILCGLGSCRVGEACGVLASEVSTSTEHSMTVARVPITRQLLRSGMSDKLKNTQSERVVCVPEPWSLRLAEIVGGSCMWLNDDGFGEPVSRGTVKRAWMRAIGDGGALSDLPRIPMQNLRNSWETFMRWELGVAPDLIDKMMGHAGKTIRQINYDRPAPDVFAETCAMAHLGMFKARKSTG